MKKIQAPLKNNKELRSLKAGDSVFLSGKIYTVRDQAHKRLAQEIKEGAKTAIDLNGVIIYYCGPAGTPRGKVIGSCGPTTSSRMDGWTPLLLKKGIMATIGKGRRSGEVVEAVKKYRGVYFLTYAGCGALLSKYIMKKRLIAYSDLGPEAIYELEVKDFPLIVGIDSRGKNIYDKGGANGSFR